MEVKVFKIKGKFRIRNIKRWQSFSMLIKGLKEEEALEKLYSLLGSNHKVKRNQIKIESIEVLSEENLAKSSNLLKKVK